MKGFSQKIYIDTLGFQTIGIGFCLDKIPMPEEVAEFWCEFILKKLDKKYGEYPGCDIQYISRPEPGPQISHFKHGLSDGHHRGLQV